MAHLRSRLAADGVLAARALEQVPHGARVRVAGHVIVRQRPGTAKGMCFLTSRRDRTANAVVTPPLYERARVVLNTSPLLEVEGRLERVDGVTHVRAARLRRLEAPASVPRTRLPLTAFLARVRDTSLNVRMRRSHADSCILLPAVRPAARRPGTAVAHRPAMLLTRAGGGVPGRASGSPWRSRLPSGFAPRGPRRDARLR